MGLPEKQYLIKTVNGYRDIALELMPCFVDYRIILLRGDLGAGKTTFVQSVAQVLGVQEEVSSPTFPIVQEYQLDEGKLFHFDLYRIEKSEDLEEIGFSEYLDSGHLCFIEWPEIGHSYFDKFLGIRIIVENGQRVLSCISSD